MSEYTDEIERIRNKSNLSTKKLERELVKHYYQASERYKEELKNVKPGSMKEAWLHNQRKAISRYMTKVSEEQEGIINKQMQSVIDEINTSTEKYFNKAAAASGLPDDLFDGMYTSMNDKVLREVLSGNLYKDGLGLSSRLWKNNSNFDKSIQNVITEGLTDKLSVYDIAKNLEGYVDPEQRKYSKYPKSGKGKNVEYNSYRLANTSVTHAYQMALSRVNKTNPFINGIEWVGGRNHNSCELCKSRNGKVYEAKRNQGVKFTTEALPLDHPNGFCNNIPYIPDDLEHIGDRLGKWARGEESDPELDDWFEKHGNKYVSAKDIQKAMKAEEEARRKAEEEAKKKAGPKEGSDEWYDLKFQGIKDEVPADIWKDIRGHIKKAPPFIQDWWASGSKYFKYAGEDGTRAYYHPLTKAITMNLKGEKNNRRNPYTTFFHEYGHLIDHLVGGNHLTHSRSTRFYEAIEKDYENLLRNNASAKMWELKPDVAKRQAENRLIRILREEGDYISGVSDIIGGLTDNKVKGIWGHSTEYWNRGNKKYEITSEMWAHMSSIYANQQNYDTMEKYFPKALEEFEWMIEQQLADEERLLNR